MFRTALKPRWLALLVVVLVAATAMAALGNWQLQRARERGSEATRERQAASPEPIESVLEPRETFPGRLLDAPVVARGRWDATRQVVVTGRLQDGVRGFWVVTPLVLADGSAVPVVRGWTAEAEDAEASVPPSGVVEARGFLRPAEPPAPRAPGQASTLPAGRLAALDVTTLVKLWPYPLLTGYVIAADPAPGLEPVDTGDEGGADLDLRNLSYALQWWLFAAFGLFFWWRLVRDDARGALRPAPASGGPAPAEPVARTNGVAPADGVAPFDGVAPADGGGASVRDDVPVENDTSQKVEHA